MKEQRNIRSVVFDLDGTLVDSMPLVLRAFAHALEPFVPPMTPEALFLRLGGPPERFFQELIADENRVPQAMQRLADFSNANWSLIQPFAGMCGLLDDLRFQGQVLAIWTGRERLSTERILNEQKIGTRIMTCVCGDDLDTHKPHPGGLEEILRRLAVAREETLFVGDADADVLAGAEMGVRTLLIRHGRVIDEVIRAKAWRVVETPAEAYATIRQVTGFRVPAAV